LRAQGPVGPVTHQRRQPALFGARPGAPAPYTGADLDGPQPRRGAPGAAAGVRALPAPRGAGAGEGAGARRRGGHAPPVPARPGAPAPVAGAVPAAHRYVGTTTKQTMTTVHTTRREM